MTKGSKFKFVRKIALPALLLVWGILLFSGFKVAWQYSGTPGKEITPLSQFPNSDLVKLYPTGYTLVLFVHPHCPCSRASIAELNRLMSRSQSNLRGYVLFLKPDSVEENWEKTDLWRSAIRIPGMKVLTDLHGKEAKRFHSITSGQTLVYDAAGHLHFSGGITPARGHQGDNEGSAQILALISSRNHSKTKTHAFGCALFGHSQNEKEL